MNQQRELSLSWLIIQVSEFSYEQLLDYPFEIINSEISIRGLSLGSRWFVYVSMSLIDQYVQKKLEGLIAYLNIDVQAVLI